MEWCIESLWNGTWICNANPLEIPWNPYGMHHSMDIPYGFHSGYGMKKWLGCQPKKKSIWSPWNGGGIHPFHMENTGECKDLCISMYFIYFSLLFFLLMTDPFVLDTFSDG